MKLFALLLLTSMLSCNIKEAKNYSNSSPKAAIEKKEVTKLIIHEDISSQQTNRKSLWNNSTDTKSSIDNRLLAIQQYSLSLSNQYQVYLSDYTKELLTSELVQVLSYFNKNIRKISKIKVTKNHVNTKKGKIKDLYIEFIKGISKNRELVLALISINQEKRDLLHNSIRNMIEINLLDALYFEGKAKKVSQIDEAELENIIDTLEYNNNLRNKLIEQDSTFSIARNIKNKLRILRIKPEQINQREELLQIQYYIDIFVE